MSEPEIAAWLKRNPAFAGWVSHEARLALARMTLDDRGYGYSPTTAMIELAIIQVEHREGRHL